MAEEKYDEIERLRFLFGRTDEKREPPSAIRRIVARLRARTQKKAVAKSVKTKTKKDAA